MAGHAGRTGRARHRDLADLHRRALAADRGVHRQLGLLGARLALVPGLVVRAPHREGKGDEKTAEAHPKLPIQSERRGCGAHSRKMISLGIESTAHTFGIGIIKADGTLLANERSVFTTEEGQGGMIPAEDAEHHTDVFQQVLDRALLKANIQLKDIDLVTYLLRYGII